MDGTGSAGDIVSAVATATRISFELYCSPECGDAQNALYLQLSSGKYDECAVLRLPANVADWREEHRTARKRANRAFTRGYTFKPILRHRRTDEIHRINLSAPQRQGRPMDDGYRRRPTETPLPTYPCDRHAVRTYGVEDTESTLVAYATVYRAGELALISQILGHADHLEHEIMYLLVQGVIGREKDGYLVYNRYDSGTEGLRFFKDRCGFAPTMVEWLP